MPSLFDEASKAYKEASMVCDVALASTFASLMMNGVCCMWQQHEDSEMREGIRRDMRTEYWHHRLMEQEEMDKHLNDPVDDDRDESGHRPPSSLVQMDRRKKLMLDKMQATSGVPSAEVTTGAASSSYGEFNNIIQSTRPTVLREHFDTLPEHNNQVVRSSLVDDEDTDDEGSLTDISLH